MDPREGCIPPLFNKDMPIVKDLSYNMQQYPHHHQQIFAHHKKIAAAAARPNPGLMSTPMFCINGGVEAAAALMDPAMNMNMPNNNVQLPMDMNMNMIGGMVVPVPVPMNMNIMHNNVPMPLLNSNVAAAPPHFGLDVVMEGQQQHNAVFLPCSSNMVPVSVSSPMALPIQGHTSSSHVVPTARPLINECQEEPVSMKNIAAPESSKRKPHRKNVQDTENSQSGNQNGNEQEEAGANKAAKEEKTVVYVRAKRGTATDSHSTTERARRQKYSQRFNCLKSLVSTCETVTGQAAILDEIINYIRCLQRLEQSLRIKLQKLTEKLMQAQALHQNRQLPQANIVKCEASVPNPVPSHAADIRSFTMSSVD